MPDVRKQPSVQAKKATSCEQKIISQVPAAARKSWWKQGRCRTQNWPSSNAWQFPRTPFIDNLWTLGRRGPIVGGVCVCVCVCDFQILRPWLQLVIGTPHLFLCTSCVLLASQSPTILDDFWHILTNHSGSVSEIREEILEILEILETPPVTRPFRHAPFSVPVT